MKDRLLSLLASGRGRIMTYAAAAAVGVAARMVARYDIDVDPAALDAVGVAVAAAVGCVINEIVLRYTTAGTKEVQESLGVKTDGYSGPVTQEAARNLASQESSIS